MNYIDTPSRSLVQRMEALAHANDIRVRRANFKKQMKAATKDVSKERTIKTLLDPPTFMHTMKAYDLLLATRGFGKTKANKYLRACTISPSKTIGGMSQRQRSSLVRVLRYGL